MQEIKIKEKQWYLSGKNFTWNKDEKGHSLTLGNWTDAGWHWNGDETQLIGFFHRLKHSTDKDQFIHQVKEAGITIEDIKDDLIKSAKEKDGLYQMSGDNVNWHFGQGYEFDADIKYHLNEYVENNTISKEQKKEVIDFFYSESEYHWTTYENYEKVYGDNYEKDVIDIIEKTIDLEDFFEKINDYSTLVDENYREWADGKYHEELDRVVKKFVKEHK